jgi:glucokinase
MYLGLEIGGTKLQLGIGPGDGTLTALWRGTVDPAAGSAGIRQQIVTAVPELLAKAGLDRSRLRGVGIGFGGPVDDATRTVLKSHQIAGWDNFPLAEWVSDLLDLPAVLGNDADVAGLAEALVGAGKGLSPIFYITIGSGIGGGLILNGEIYRGCGRGAAEIGHLMVPCLRQGVIPQIQHEELHPLEEFASGWAIGRIARECALGIREFKTRHEVFNKVAPNSELFRNVCGQIDRLTAQHVAQAAARGDVFATCILHEVWCNLAEAMVTVLTLLCPRRFVIGGGVALMGEELLFEPLRSLVAERVFKPFADCYDIVPAALGEEVVVHGALALARKYLPEAAD